MKRLFSALAFSATFPLTVQAATLSVTLEDRSSGQGTPLTTLTLNFGNSTDNATTFGSADFVSRSLENLDNFGVSNLVSNQGAFPVSNLDNTTVTITGTVTSDAVFNFGFNFTEANSSFSVFDFDRVAGNRLRGFARWTSIDGFAPNFYVQSFGYDATGTAADFSAPDVNGQVPLPAGLPLALTGLAGFALLRRREV